MGGLRSILWVHKMAHRIYDCKAAGPHYSTRMWVPPYMFCFPSIPRLNKCTLSCKDEAILECDVMEGRKLQHVFRWLMMSSVQPSACFENVWRKNKMRWNWKPWSRNIWEFDRAFGPHKLIAFIFHPLGFMSVNSPILRKVKVCIKR